MKLVSKIFKRDWLVFVVLAFVVFGVYANILDNDFVWDDYVFIYNWEAIQKPLENVSELLFSLPERQTNFRPIKNAFYATGYHFFGQNPAGYHAIAVVVHITNVSIVYLIAAKFFKKRLMGFFSALIFGLHPINVEAVAWVTASMDTLGHTFYLLSFWFYVSFRNGQKNKWLWLSYATTAMAFLTNELTFSLVPTIVIYDLVILKIKIKKEHGAVKRWFGYMGLMGAYFVFKFLLNGPGVGLEATRIWIGVIALAEYLKLLFLPIKLTTNHHVWGDINAFYNFDLPFVGSAVWPKITDFQVVLSTVVILMMTFCAFKYRTKHPMVLFCFGSLIFSFLPVMQIIPTTAIFAERYAYIASVFFAMLVTYWLILAQNWAIKKNKMSVLSSQFILMCLLSVFIFGYGFRTVKRNQDWQSALSLWNEAVNVNPKSAMNHANLGKAYLDKLDLENASVYLNKSVELNPNYPVALSNLGAVNNINENYVAALGYYEKARSLDPKFNPARNGVAVSYLGVGEYEKARTIASEIVSENSKSVFGNLLIAKSFHKQFVFNQAENYYLKVLEIEPENLDALNNLGNLYVEWGRTDEARSKYEKVLEIDENYGDVREKIKGLE